MPFKSQQQRKWMFAAEDRGEVPKGTAEKWAKDTPNMEDLPKRAAKKVNTKAVKKRKR